MGETTGISWTHHTFNPWAGCVKVSPACDNCYAEADTKRRGFVEWGKDAERRRTSPSYWKQLRKWDSEARRVGERRRVFVGSWCDIMEDRDELQTIREDLYGEIDHCQSLDFLLLTKRPQNFRRFLPASWLSFRADNVWGMTTVESPEYYWRAQRLAATPFVVRGLSIEPLLAAVDDVPLEGIDWVIVGGESQHGARPMRPEWARALRDRCVEAGVAFHFKQWGEHDANLVKIGKQKAGHLLDGIEWLQVPKGIAI